MLLLANFNFFPKSFRRIEINLRSQDEIIGTMGMLNMLTLILYFAGGTIAVLNSFKELSRRSALEELVHKMTIGDREGGASRTPIRGLWGQHGGI